MCECSLCVKDLDPGAPIECRGSAKGEETPTWRCLPGEAGASPSMPWAGTHKARPRAAHPRALVRWSTKERGEERTPLCARGRGKGTASTGDGSEGLHAQKIKKEKEKVLSHCLRDCTSLYVFCCGGLACGVESLKWR